MPRAAALSLLQSIIDSRAADERVKTAMREIWPDLGLFGSVNDKVEAAAMAFIEKVIGCDVCSYFLYDCSRSGGLIIVDGVEYPIKSVADIAVYLEKTRPE